MPELHNVILPSDDFGIGCKGCGYVQQPLDRQLFDWTGYVQHSDDPVQRTFHLEAVAMRESAPQFVRLTMS